MVSPGRGGDWGKVILIDSRIGNFIEKAVNYDEDNSIDEFKKDFSDETWTFLKQEFDAVAQDDEEFLQSIYESWDSLMSDNYYLFSGLKSTVQLESITKLIQYVNEHTLEVIGDLT